MELKIFENKEFGQIRIIERDGEPWFVAKDICEILGHTNPTVAMQMLENDERTKLYLGRQGETNVVNESGLYALILRSNKPQAKQFRKWVTSEVLPSIRKNDGYIKNQENSSDEQILANALIVAQKVIENKNKMIELMKPKADYFDNLVERNLLTNLRDTAKQLGVGEKNFIEWLLNNKYIYRDMRKKPKPYAQHMELFSLKDFEKNGHADNQTLVTPKGKETFRLLLQKEGLI